MSDPKRMLNYEPPPPVVLSGARMVWQCFFACVTTVIGFGMAIGVCFGIGGKTSPAVGVAAWVLVLGLLMYLAVVKQRRPESRGYGIGIWLGLGVFFLLAGICFRGL